MHQSQALEPVIEAAAPVIVAQLLGTARSFFARLGEAETSEAVWQLLNAGVQDLQAGKFSATRTMLSRWINRHAASGLVFTDVRLLCVTVRQAILAQLGDQQELSTDELNTLDLWFLECALIGAQYFTAQRESTIRDQQGQLEIKLSELRNLYEMQEATMQVLREVWVPIASIYPGVLVVPMVGSIDEERAGGLMERLLVTITRDRARYILLDISGVQVVDTLIAQSLIRMAQATRLLGAEMVLVGIVPEIAQTIVQLGINLNDIVTCSTLAEGLSFALRQMGLRISR